MWNDYYLIMINKHLAVELLSLKVDFNFLRNFQTLFQSDYSILCSYEQCMRVPVHVIYISLVTKDEQLFMCHYVSVCICVCVCVSVSMCVKSLLSLAQLKYLIIVLLVNC